MVEAVGRGDRWWTTRQWQVLAFVFAALLTGCGQDKPPPSIISVSPARLPQQLESTLDVQGQNLFTEVRGALDPGAPFIDGRFTIRVADQQAFSLEPMGPQVVRARMPAGLPIGLQTVSLTTPGGLSTALADAVRVEPVALSLESAPSGTGEAIESRSIQVGMSQTLFAVVRFEDGTYYRDEDVTWSVNGNGGSLSTSAGASATFDATMQGTATVTASHAALGEVSVTFNVRRCNSDADCIDACHASATCTSGACAQGPADKDSDGDGFIDIVCEGGDDCDDNPETCGANCFPENTAPDGCDGFDQECDGEIDEDPDATWYEDLDGDGFGKSDVFQVTCTPLVGYAPDGSDCDDDPQSCGDACSPGTDETLAEGNCADALDNDCDGDIDDLDRSCIAPNTPPAVTMLVSPGAGTTATTFAGSVTAVDLEDDSGLLTVEWDWDGDGTFEASGMGATHRFAEVGNFDVISRVRDSGGLETWTRVEVTVADPGLIVVTTEADENDANPTPDAPGGSGLSLREALAYANTLASPTIYVPSAFDITLSSALVHTSNDTRLFADAAVVRCTGYYEGLVIEGSNNTVFGLTAENCSMGFRIQGSGNRLVRVGATNNSHMGVQLNGVGSVLGPDAQIIGNGIGVQAARMSTVHQSTVAMNTSEGIQVGSQANGSDLWGNVIYDNRSGVVLSKVNTTTVRFNTIDGNDDHGIQVSGGSRQVTLQCNILSHNGRHGLQAGTSDFTERGYNDYFSNGNGPCTSCSPQTTSFQLDPEFIDRPAGDFRLSPFSALIDRCPDLGLDLNTAAPGLFGGNAPDVGGWESPYD